MGDWRNAPRRAVRDLPPDARRPATSTTSGVLRPDLLAQQTTRWRSPVGPDLEPWVEYYWSVRWSLGEGETYRSEIVPHPTVHLTFESGTTEHHGFAMPAALVTGLPTRRWSFEGTGEGRVFGVKFRPGGFAAFTGAEPWVDRADHAAAPFGPVIEHLLVDVLESPTDDERAAVVEDALAARAPAADPRYDRLVAIVGGLIADSSLVSVDAVCDRFGLASRTLQRLFRDYVGVGPKWVLQRYRLHDAVTLIDAGEYGDLAGLAASLGWFDQAHFTRDFTAQVGVSPATYAARRTS